MFNEFRVAVERQFYSDSVTLHFMEMLPDNKMSLVKNLVMETVERNAVVDFLPRGISISAKWAQTLMDELWGCGIRPTEGAGTAGAMRQAEDHLKTLKQENDRLHEYIATLIKRNGNHE